MAGHQCPNGNVYVTDPPNCVMRKIGADGHVSTLVDQRWKGFLIDEPTGVPVNGATL